MHNQLMNTSYLLAKHFSTLTSRAARLRWLEYIFSTTPSYFSRSYFSLHIL
jgi:hypothetical protein